MTPKRARIICRLLALPIGLSMSGCFIPGGGWTMRTGVDLRRPKKPSAFVELVDTRWDEYNRIAEINTFSVPVSYSNTAPPAVPSSTFGPAAGPHLMEGISAPPASDPGPATSDPTTPEPPLPGNPSANDATADEPSRLPGDADTPSRSPFPRDLPTARQSSPDDSPTETTTVNKPVVDQMGGTSAPRATRKSWRPIASRLFTRPQ